jgi:general L-amino acid transport system substrate-binding protein
MMSILRVFAVFTLCFAASAAAAGPRLDAITTRGALNCGVAIAEPGMSEQDGAGNYVGFEPDICRAIAAAIFGAPNVTFSPTVTLAAFLQSDDVDLVIRGLTRSYWRDVGGSVHFGPTILHNGQTFLVRTALGAENFADLSGRTICVSSDIYADFFHPLRRYFDAHGLVFDGVGTQTRAESEMRFFAGECDAVTADYAELASAIIKHDGDPSDFAVLPGHMEEEPLAPLLRKGDDEFYAIVSWAIYALINAEALGIDSENVEEMRRSTEPQTLSFFRAPPPASGFHRQWSYAIIRSVGNYEEIFMRHLGGPGAANLPRGPNRLWLDGGLLYAPPIR